ncbi:MAG: class I SAM-dependent methyltransferase [Deltaproteobacteria bacterium]|nr:class I SAM-dependent methyltransferase [Deltaproteobacteria bacterium]
MSKRKKAKARKEAALLLRAQFSEHSQSLPAVSERELALYEHHHELLQRWSARMNLVSARTLPNAYAVHYADSIHICDIAAPHCGSIPAFDIGTGAGFPGIVFAIRNPNNAITLFEKSNKKCLFLREVISELGLGNVRLEQELPQHLYRGVFFARATFPPAEFFQIFRGRGVTGSYLVVNTGGKSEPVNAPHDFVEKENRLYVLPEDFGRRRVQIFGYVPRETKTN